MSLLRTLPTRALPLLRTRPFSTSPYVSRSAVEGTKDVIDAVNRSVGKGIKKGIETGGESIRLQFGKNTSISSRLESLVLNMCRGRSWSSKVYGWHKYIRGRRVRQRSCRRRQGKGSRIGWSSKGQGLRASWQGEGRGLECHWREVGWTHRGGKGEDIGAVGEGEGCCLECHRRKARWTHRRGKGKGIGAFRKGKRHNGQCKWTGERKSGRSQVKVLDFRHSGNWAQFLSMGSFGVCTCSTYVASMLGRARIRVWYSARSIEDLATEIQANMQNESPYSPHSKNDS